MVSGKRAVGWGLLVAVAQGRRRVSDERLTGAVDGRVVLVTGASYGIGEATARRLGRAGATVLLVARTAERLEEVAGEIRAAGGNADVYVVNLADPDAVEGLVRTVLEEHGRVDVLVSNAGRSIRRSIADSYQRFHDIERTNAINYLGPAKLVLELLPSMRDRGSGHIVNVSTAGVRTPPMARWSAYLASKSAFDVWLRCVRAGGPQRRGDRVDGLHGSGAHADERADAVAEQDAGSDAGAGRGSAVYGDRRPDAQHHAAEVRPAELLGNLFRIPTDRLLEQYFRISSKRKRPTGDDES